MTPENKAKRRILIQEGVSEQLLNERYDDIIKDYEYQFSVRYDRNGRPYMEYRYLKKVCVWLDTCEFLSIKEMENLVPQFKKRRTLDGKH